MEDNELISFTWDEEKNQKNIAKHGISFMEALNVFFDSKRIERYDERHSTIDESRYLTIGNIGTIVFVVFTERKDITRIISARRANKEECDEYYRDYDKR